MHVFIYIINIDWNILKNINLLNFHIYIFKYFENNF